jgi:putative hemolysin
MNKKLIVILVLLWFIIAAAVSWQAFIIKKEDAAICSTYEADACPSGCVVCPPCPTCSSISCQTTEFCQKMGIDPSWYQKQMDIQQKQKIRITQSTEQNTVNMANPASVYCEKNGGKLEIVTDSTGSQSGLCHFPDGSTCEEWAYMRGTCKQGE